MKFAKEVHEKMKKHLQAFMPPREAPFIKRAAVWIVLVGAGAIIAGLLLFTLMAAIFSIALPDVRNFDKLAGTGTTLIYNRGGGILYTIHGEENRKYVPLGDISPILQKATIAIEDDQFYEHSGFDIPGIIKALMYEFGIGSRRGGSTIPQQLAKDAFLS